MMNGPEKSDSVIVAGKPMNKAEWSATELVERRAGTKGNADQRSTRWTQSRISVSQGVGSHTAAFCRRYPRWEPYAGCDRKAGMSLPVKVWSVQSRAGRTGASLAGVVVTRGPKRRQRLDGVWN